MPREVRTDFPGAIHHVIVRGLDRRTLFSDPEDYENFKSRLGSILLTTRSRALAWSLMPNHVHLVIQSGIRGPTKIMQVLLTGYGLHYNKKRQRSGYVFQGRFKSLLCQDEAYCLELLRYVHLNPVRAGLIKGLPELVSWRWSGHRALLGKEDLEWQERSAILARFSNRPGNQKKAYLSFLEDGLAGPPLDPDLGGRGLVRALGGLWETESQNKPSPRRRLGEEGLAGHEKFMRAVLEEARELDNRRGRLERMGWTTAKVLARAASVVGLEARQIRGAGKEPRQSRARALVCKWLVEDLGRSTVSVARELRIGQPAVVGSMKRGRSLELELAVRLEGPARS